MKTITKYVADDGHEFEDRGECELHEIRTEKIKEATKELSTFADSNLPTVEEDWDGSTDCIHNIFRERVLEDLVSWLVQRGFFNHEE